MAEGGRVESEKWGSARLPRISIDHSGSGYPGLRGPLKDRRHGPPAERSKRQLLILLRPVGTWNAQTPCPMASCPGPSSFVVSCGPWFWSFLPQYIFQSWAVQTFHSILCVCWPWLPGRGPGFVAFCNSRHTLVSDDLIIGEIVFALRHWDNACVGGTWDMLSLLSLTSFHGGATRQRPMHHNLFAVSLLTSSVGARHGANRFLKLI